MAIRKRPLPSTKVRVSIFNRITLFEISETRRRDWFTPALAIISIIVGVVAAIATVRGTAVAEDVAKNNRQVDTLGFILDTLRRQTKILQAEDSSIQLEVEQMRMIANSLAFQSQKLSAQLEYSNGEQKFRNNNQHIERAKELFELKKSANDLRDSLYLEDNKHGRTKEEDLKFVTQVKDFFDKAIGYPVLLEDSAFFFKMLEYKYNLPGLTVELEYVGTSAETFQVNCLTENDAPPIETLDSLRKIKRKQAINDCVVRYLKEQNIQWNRDYKKLTESLSDFLKTILNPFFAKKFKEYSLPQTN